MVVQDWRLETHVLVPNTCSTNGAEIDCTGAL